MSLCIRSKRERRSVESKKAAHAKAVEVMDEVYDLIEEHCTSTHIERGLLESLKIDYQDLHLGSDGTYLNSILPVFFQPRPLARLPPPDLRDDLTRTEFEEHQRYFQGPSRYERTPRDGAEALSSVMQWTFTTFQRVTEEDVEFSPSLMSLTRWLPVDFSPSIINDEFDGPVFSSLQWAPGDAWTTETGSSHIMFTIILGYDPDERLLRAELVSIAAAIITRLADADYEDHSVVPVMIISLFGGRKARIIQGHNNEKGMVIRKSSLYSFSSTEEAMKSVDLLMQFMASEVAGDTTDPKNFFEMSKFF